MPFLSNDPLVLEFIDGTTWQVQDPFVYIIDASHQVSVPAGFQTDLASVPKIFWNIYSPSGGLYTKAAVIHDYMYRFASVENTQLGKPERIDKAYADNVFFQAMKDAGSSWYTRYLFYYGVKIGGQSAWNRWRSINP